MKLLGGGTDRAETIAFGLGLIALVVLLVFIPYVPFQDYPQHLHALRVDEALSGKGLAPHYEYLGVSSFGTFLLPTLVRALRPLLGTDMALRVSLAIGVIGLPIGVARLAGELGAPRARAGFLALPFALSWPVCMGFVPTVLGLACTCFAVSASLAACKSRSRRAILELVFWLAMSWAAHTFAVLTSVAFVVAALLGQAATCALRVRWRIPLLVSLGIVVVLGAYFSHARLAHFRQLPYHRPILANLLTLPYTATTPRHVIAVIPHAALITFCAFTGLRGRPIAGQLPILAVLLMSLFLATALPELVPHMAFTGTRLTALVGAVTAAAAARTALLSTNAGRGFAAVAVSLALAWSFADIYGRSQDIQAEVGVRPPRDVGGRLLPVRVFRCPEPQQAVQEEYDHLLHAWTYALDVDAVSPYLFAGGQFGSQSISIALRNKTLEPAFPKEPLLLHRFTVFGPHELQCDEVRRARLLSASTWHGYDAILVSGAPNELDAVLRETDLPILQRVAPGIVLLPAAPKTSIVAYTKFALRDMAQVHELGAWGPAAGVGSGPGSIRRYAGSGAGVLFQVPVVPETPLLLEVSGIFPGTGEALVRVNGIEVGRIVLEPSQEQIWRRSGWRLKPGVLTPGENRLRFDIDGQPWDLGNGFAILLDDFKVVPATTPGEQIPIP